MPRVASASRRSGLGSPRWGGGFTADIGNALRELAGYTLGDDRRCHESMFGPCGDRGFLRRCPAARSPDNLKSVDQDGLLFYICSVDREFALSLHGDFDIVTQGGG